jgi:hypothetical protein
MLTSDVLSYYSELLIVQYVSLPNAIGTIQAYVGALVQNQITTQVQEAFELATASGAQLTILGTYRGIPRQLFGLPSGNYWSLVPYNDPSPDSYYGWATYAGSAPNWLWLQYDDVTTAVLTDPQMRRMIQFKALLDSSPLTLGALDAILYTTFGIYVNLVDNGNMTMTYQHQSIDPDPDDLWGAVVLAQILPNSCGVLANVVSI